MRHERELVSANFTEIKRIINSYTPTTGSAINSYTPQEVDKFSDIQNVKTDSRNKI